MDEYTRAETTQRAVGTIRHGRDSGALETSRRPGRYSRRQSSSMFFSERSRRPGPSTAARARHVRQAPHPSSGFIPLLVQSLPLVLYHPVRRMASWTFFLFTWLMLIHRDVPRFVGLITALLLTRVFRAVIFPLSGIALKWLLIGRHHAGRYRLWGSYYLRWWLIHQVLRFCGRGVFDLSNGARCAYYRLLGAKIGVGVCIAAQARLTEPDLVTIGDGCALDARCVVSPFCADGGEMMLSAIVLGDDVAVCTKTVVAPGAVLADGKSLPPLSSSHEEADASFGHAAYCRAAFPPPPALMQLAIGLPVIAAVKIVQQAPPPACADRPPRVRVLSRTGSGLVWMDI